MFRIAVLCLLSLAACQAPEPERIESGLEDHPKPQPPPPACFTDAECSSLGEGAGCWNGACVAAEDYEPLAWQQPTGPGSLGFRVDMVTSGEIIALSGYTNILVSHDGGQTWRASRDFESMRMDDLVFSGRTLFLRDAIGRLFRSYDWGNSWGPAHDQRVEAIHAIGDEVWVLGTREEDFSQYMLYSSDGGESFETLEDAPMILYPGEEFLLGRTASGTVISHDRGRTWEELALPIRIDGAGFVIWKGSIFAFGEDVFDHGFLERAIWASHDQGATWGPAVRLLTPPNSLDRIEATPDGLFYVSSRGGLDWLSEPEGSWENLLDGTTNGFNVPAAHGSDAGLFRLVKGSLEKWDVERRVSVPVGTMPLQGAVFDLSSDGDMVYAVVDGSHVQRSDDGGRTWERCPDPTWNNGVGKEGYSDLTRVIAYEGSVWVGSFWFGFWRSDDGCQTWTPLTDALPAYGSMVGEMHRAVIDVHVDESGMYLCTGGMEQVAGTEGGFASTSVGILRSVDGGGSWTPARDGLPGAGANLVEELFAPCTDVMGAAGQLFTSTAEGVFRSSNEGGWWEKVEGPKLGQFDAALVSVVDAGDRLVGHFADGMLHESVDGGASFSAIAGIGNVQSLVRAGDRLIALTNVIGDDVVVDQELWWSADGAATWEKLDADPTVDALANLLHAAGGQLLLSAQGAGVSRLPLDRMP